MLILTDGFDLQNLYLPCCLGPYKYSCQLAFYFAQRL